tara:strand:+ start:784 stop:1023 length:240 start_codon:yes stop_codon:yes gene_type:complete
MIEWLKRLLYEEWEITIFYPAETRVLADGTRVESLKPKTYRAKALKKISEKHFKFIDTDGVLHEIKVVNPVGYDIKKVY